jgi:DNA (cytosine-5)-methyltransferase 1
VTPLDLTIGSLFSGVGGYELGLERAGLGATVWQCELSPFCRQILAKHWPHAERFSDVRLIGKGTHVENFMGAEYRRERKQLPYVDVICGGFPCQDVSLAGAGAGLAGDQSGLWFEFARIVRDVRPRFVAIENVAALAARGLVTVLSDLAEAGYDAIWFPLSAKDVGAPHKRERLFVVAWRVSDANGEPLRLEQQRHEGRRGGIRDEGQPEFGHVGEESVDVANSNSERQQGLSSSRLHEGRSQRHDVARCGEHAWPPPPNDADEWRTWTERGGPQPGIRGGAARFPDGLDRLEALGNAVCPQVAEVVGHVIRQLLDEAEVPRV